MDRTLVAILHKLGMRILQLTYMERNHLGSGCFEPVDHGLLPHDPPTHFRLQCAAHLCGAFKQDDVPFCARPVAGDGHPDSEAGKRGSHP
jgi:hypothetical protein